MANMELITGDLATDHPRYGELLAIIVERNGEDVLVLSLEIVPDEASAKRWFQEESVTQPWVERS